MCRLMLLLLFTELIESGQKFEIIFGISGVNSESFIQFRFLDQKYAHTAPKIKRSELAAFNECHFHER